VNSVSIKFNKKGKPFFGKDPNSINLTIDQVKITNIDVNEK
jgi:hypothetical protein